MSRVLVSFQPAFYKQAQLGEWNFQELCKLARVTVTILVRFSLWSVHILVMYMFLSPRH